MSQFEQKAAPEAFRTFLGGRGLDEVTLTVRDGFDACSTSIGHPNVASSKSNARG
jgi:hypothetical protein